MGGKAEKLILCCNLCPGDVLTMTAAVESLHATYPGEYLTDVETPVAEIWQHNPRITPLKGSGRRLQLQYPSVHQSNQVPHCFLGGYTLDLGRQLGRPLQLRVNRPQLYLADDEKKWLNQVRGLDQANRRRPFWLVNAGVKDDYPAKQWPVEYFQQVVRETIGLIQWVQIGSREHDHPRLDGAIDLRGKTDHRQLIRLAWHAAGGLGPVTYLQHLMAAWQKPYVCLLGGREPVSWVQYPKQVTLHTVGQLPCCRSGACWKSKVLAGPGETEKLCQRPLFGLKRPVAECMAMIRPEEVTAVLRRMAHG